MTPYRDEEASSPAPVQTRGYGGGGAAMGFALSLGFGAVTLAVNAGWIAKLLSASMMVVSALIANSTIRRITVSGERVLVREGLFGGRVTCSISIAEGADVRVTRAAGMRTRRRGKTEPYVSHLVEVHTPHGSWVIFESEDAARADAMANFVQSSLPPRLRVESLPPARIAATDERADEPASERRRKLVE